MRKILLANVCVFLLAVSTRAIPMNLQKNVAESATVSSTEKTTLLDQIIGVLGTIFALVMKSPMVQNALNSTSNLQPSSSAPIVIQVTPLADNSSSNNSSFSSQADNVSQNDTVLQSVTEVQDQESDMQSDNTIYLYQDNGTEVNQNETEGMGMKQEGEPVVLVTDQPYINATAFTEDIVNQTTNSSASIQQSVQTNVSQQQDVQAVTVNQTAAVQQLTQSMNQSANMTANSDQTVITVENSTETSDSTSGDLMQTVAVQQQGQVLENATQYDFNFTSTTSSLTIQQQNFTELLVLNQSQSTDSPIADNSTSNDGLIQVMGNQQQTQSTDSPIADNFTSNDGLIQVMVNQQQNQAPPDSNQMLNDTVLNVPKNTTSIREITLSNQQLSVQLLQDLKTILLSFLNTFENSTSTTPAPSVI